jgi:transglutaminase-like putative cysteine protease
MDRRSFLKTSVGAPAAVALSQLPAFTRAARAQHREFNPRPGSWRTFEMTTRVEVLRPAGVTRVWVPVPVVASDYQRPGESAWTGTARTMRTVTEPRYGAAMLYAEFAEGEAGPVVEVTSRFQTRDRAVDWTKKVQTQEDPATLKMWTAPTDLMPTDGIVKDTAVEITRGTSTDFEKVKAVYDWILANTYREPKVRGCGVGDIKAMLETKNFGGKCADLNGLFVGLVRAAGVPARDVYGIRVAPSAFGYRSLGAGSPNVSKAQHCRAEVFLKDYGWVAMDPADVAKAAREETSEPLPIDHPLIAAVRPKLFGGWEGNWLGYNTAHDVALPNATKGGKIGFLMYPQAETAEGRRDSLDPDTFKYTITAREIAS